MPLRRRWHISIPITTLEHLNRTRVLRACSLMRVSEDSILSISGKVGFQSLSSFNRHFMAEMGTTPSKWRRAEGNNPKTAVLKYAGWLTPPDSIEMEAARHRKNEAARYRKNK